MALKDILFIVLIALSVVLAALVVLILKKRGVFGKKKKDDDIPKPGPEETGPTDHDAIKETLKTDVEEAPAPPAREISAPEPREPQRRMRFPFGRKDEEDQPFPPMNEGNAQPAGEAEEGLELSEAPAPARERVEEAPQPPRRKARNEPVGFVDMGEDIGTQEEAPVEEPAPAPARRPQKSAPAEDVPTRGSAGRGEALSTADIAQSPQGYKGHAVSITGDLRLSSRGADDAWYILFDGKGSVVVRSKSEIPYTRARILAKVEQTRLGQVYLDVTKAEKA